MEAQLEHRKKLLRDYRQSRDAWMDPGYQEAEAKASMAGTTLPVAKLGELAELERAVAAKDEIAEMVQVKHQAEAKLVQLLTLTLTLTLTLIE